MAIVQYRQDYYHVQNKANLPPKKQIKLNQKLKLLPNIIKTT